MLLKYCFAFYLFHLKVLQNVYFNKTSGKNMLKTLSA